LCLGKRRAVLGRALRLRTLFARMSARLVVLGVMVEADELALSGSA